MKVLTAMTTESIPSQATPRTDIAAWKEIVAKYQKPSTGRALWQIVDTLGPYTLLWYLMYLSLAVSWWLTVPLAILAGAFLVRVFIIFHDCGHAPSSNPDRRTT
jgi:omega-6 fatty acid desaturase (delta-12 desaturase)